MSQNYAYNYAIIEPSMGNMCVDVRTTSVDCSGMENYIEIPVFDGEYLMKYYIGGNWYEDAEGTIPWTSSLL